MNLYDYLLESATALDAGTASRRVIASLLRNGWGYHGLADDVENYATDVGLAARLRQAAKQIRSLTDEDIDALNSAAALRPLSDPVATMRVVVAIDELRAEGPSAEDRIAAALEVLEAPVEDGYHVAPPASPSVDEAANAILDALENTGDVLWLVYPDDDDVAAGRAEAHALIYPILEQVMLQYPLPLKWGTP